MKIKKSGVYEIINMVNGKTYIGSSIDLSNRIQQHILKLSNNKHPNPILQNAWNKYGKNYFYFHILLFCDPENTLMYEQLCIDGMKPKYNISTNTTAPNKGRVFSDEVRAKISKAGIGRVKSDETRLKLSLSGKGRKQSEEHIRNHAMSILGKHPSIETRKKMSESRLGKTFSDEHKSKLGAKTKERWASEEYRERLSKSLTGRVFSEETKQKMRDSWAQKRLLKQVQNAA